MNVGIYFCKSLIKYYVPSVRNVWDAMAFTTHNSKYLPKFIKIYMFFIIFFLAFCVVNPFVHSVRNRVEYSAAEFAPEPVVLNHVTT